MATPWALAGESVPLAVAATVVLIGLPTVFSTPGDKHHVPVAVPGVASAAIVILHVAAAVAAAWFAWPRWAAVAVIVLAVITLATERAHLRWLIRQPGRVGADDAGGATRRP
ncbi:hypothetical protein [Yinghuangia sp. ASG 101]|uniref:hypothetical protein n=1 Tax=Yinghuangia sp. ASG 101 TaxID=2896848 RepID=UPI002F917454